MATHAHSTRTPLLPLAGPLPPLLGRGSGRQPGPVTRAIAIMREADPDLARIRALRRAIAERIEADIAFLDATGGDPDFEADYTTIERHAEGFLYEVGRSTDDEPSLCGSGVELPSIGGDDREDGDDNGIADIGGWQDQKLRSMGVLR